LIFSFIILCHTIAIYLHAECKRYWSRHMLFLNSTNKGENIIKRKKLFIFTFLILFLTTISNLNQTTTVKADSQINNYIIQNKFQPATIQYRQGTFNVWQGYRHGVGKPEGVIVHETATPNVNAEQFVKSFNNNWPRLQTYVHAFVDDQQALNIHSSDYLVWGAGPTANSRYIQVELCRVNSYDAFARSLANDANYVARKLIQYNLPDVPHQTVLSHKETGPMFGETNHQDPDSYFAAWGYDMNQFNELISLYYNNLKNSGNVYGTVTPAPAPNPEPTNPTPEPSTNHTIKVNNPNGSYVPLVTFKNDGTTAQIRNRALANKTLWYTDQTKSVDGVTYHRVATTEWVAETYKM